MTSVFKRGISVSLPPSPLYISSPPSFHALKNHAFRLQVGFLVLRFVILCSLGVPLDFSRSKPSILSLF